MTTLLCLALGLGLSASAAGTDLRDAAASGRVPDAWATRSPDGVWTLVLQPAAGWSAAEVSVRGGTAVDVGPAGQGEAVTLEGAGAPTGALAVRVMAAVDGGTGVEWRFDVDPVSVPVAAPQFERRERRRGFFSRWFRR